MIYKINDQIFFRQICLINRCFRQIGWCQRVVGAGIEMLEVKYLHDIVFYQLGRSDSTGYNIIVLVYPLVKLSKVIPIS